MKNMTQGVEWTLLSMLLLGVTGCAGYRLGPVNGGAAGARSVQVKFFDNQTLEPRLVSAVNHSLRQHLQQDGTFRVETDGDLVVSGMLKEFTRDGVNYKPSDILAVKHYNLRLNARVIVTDRKTGKVVIDREITGSATTPVGTDFASSQRQAVPLIADQLALRATSLIADGEWPTDGSGTDGN